MTLRVPEQAQHVFVEGLHLAYREEQATLEYAPMDIGFVGATTATPLGYGLEPIPQKTARIIQVNPKNKVLTVQTAAQAASVIKTELGLEVNEKRFRQMEIPGLDDQHQSQIAWICILAKWSS